MARRKQTGRHRLQSRLTRSLDCFLAQTPWPTLPDKPPLIAVADAIIQYIDHKPYTVYCIVVRTALSNQAVIAPPFIRSGTEVCVGWNEAFEQLPTEVKSSTVALVCDGHKGLVLYAQKHGWLIQRCHFHILARIQMYCSRWPTGRQRAVATRVNVLVRDILTCFDEVHLEQKLLNLNRFAQQASSQALQVVIQGFITNYQDFRTYLHHPALRLPRTTNSVESLNSSIRDLCHRARGFSTLSAFSKWIYAILKNKKTATCNGFIQPNYGA